MSYLDLFPREYLEQLLAARQIRPDDPDSCFEWAGSVWNTGYARIHTKKGERKKWELIAYRLAWELENGPIPETHDRKNRIEVGHRCHDEAAHRGECDGGIACPHRRCTNPRHLKLETPQTNPHNSPHTVAAINRSKERCGPCGGPYVFQKSTGRRICRACKRATWHNIRARRKVAV